MDNVLNICKTDELRRQVVGQIDMTHEIGDEEIYEIIDRVIVTEGRKYYFSVSDKCRIRCEIFNSIRGMDVLEELIEDENITEIMVNGPDEIFVEKEGRIERYEKKFSSSDRLDSVIQQIVSKVNRQVNESSPIVDARLADGSRVNIVLKPIALNGPIITIRKFPKNNMTIEDLIKYHSLSKECADEIKIWVEAKYNIFVSGGTGSGKTTFLNAISNFIPEDERVITIEDSAELRLKAVKNLVSLEVRNANSEGNKAISIRDLMKTSLRMRPDRIIVGEVRGGEALDMLQSLNSGHDGSMSTGHANSSEDMLARVETMVLTGIDMPLTAVKSQIVSGIDIVIHLGRLRDKSRRVLEIKELIGLSEGKYVMNELYHFHESGEKNGMIYGALKKTGELQNSEKLKRKKGR